MQPSLPGLLCLPFKRLISVCTYCGYNQGACTGAGGMRARVLCAEGRRGGNAAKCLCWGEEHQPEPLLRCSQERSGRTWRCRASRFPVWRWERRPVKYAAVLCLARRNMFVKKILFHVDDERTDEKKNSIWSSCLITAWYGDVVYQIKLLVEIILGWKACLL